MDGKLPPSPSCLPNANACRSAVFQAGGLVVVLVEVMRKAYLASIVPVIVNTVLNEHQVIVDIVAFVSKGDFPRSRLGEKQRGKILASWVTRKMRTIAQFGIRDPDAADSQITEVAEPRSGLGSVVGVGSSLKNVQSVASPPANPAYEQAQHYTSLPTGISEMPATYESSIVESPPLPPPEEDRDDTPTEPRTHNHFSPTDDHSQHSSAASYTAYSDNQLPFRPIPTHNSSSPDEYPDYQAYTTHDPDATPSNPTHTFDFTSDAPPPPARYDSKPTLTLSNPSAPDPDNDGDLYSLPSQKRYSQLQLQTDYPPSNHHPLRGSSSSNNNNGLSHTPSNASSDHYDMDDEWRQEARMHMNLARDGSRRDGHVGERAGGGGYAAYDGSEYGHAM